MFNREPVAIASAVRLVLLAAVSFGLELTDTQLISVMSAFEAVLSLLTRSQVSPVPVVQAALSLPKGATMAEAIAESRK